jgi:hypothetical protein
MTITITINCSQISCNCTQPTEAGAFVQPWVLLESLPGLYLQVALNCIDLVEPLDEIGPVICAGAASTTGHATGAAYVCQAPPESIPPATAQVAKASAWY